MSNKTISNFRNLRKNWGGWKGAKKWRKEKGVRWSQGEEIKGGNCVLSYIYTYTVYRYTVWTHTCAHQPRRRRAKQTSHRNQIDFLYHLAGSSHQNINTIFIDAATAPAAAAASWEREWGSENRKEGERAREEMNKEEEKKKKEEAEVQIIF